MNILEPIALMRNKYHVSVDLTREDEDTGKQIPAEGLTVSARICDAMSDGTGEIPAAIHPDLEIVLVPLTNKANSYHGDFDGEDIRLNLYSRLNSDVFVVFYDDDGNFAVGSRVRVVKNRLATRV